MGVRERDDDLEQSTTRWIAVGFALTVVFALMFPLYRWYEPTGRAEARSELKASLAAQGSGLYGASCASCHGAAGEGVDAPALNSQQFLEAAADEQIASLIAHGVPGTEMSAYSLDFGGFLTSQQIGALTTYLRSLEADAPDRPDWRFPEAGDGHDEGEEDEAGHDDEAAVAEEPTDHDDDAAVAEEPTDHDDDAAVAEEPAAIDAATRYESSCARCHGTDLRGDTGPALGPTSHSLTEPDEHLVEAITFGRGGMPAFTNELTAGDIEELVRYIRTVQEGG